MTDGNTILSVAKAMELLQVLADAGQPMVLTAIAERTAMPKSTVFGLLTTMRNYDVIAQRQDGKYTLGLRLFEFGCQVSRAWDIASVARPFMEHLAANVNASVMLSICEGTHVITLDQVEGREKLRVISDIGARLPVYCTSQGKVFLAGMPEAEAKSLLARVQPVQYTPHTVTDMQELLYLLRQVRADGYAIENGEYKIGLRSISAPVYTLEGKLKYTVGVIGMFRSVRSEEFHQAIEQVVQTGKMISSALGCR